MEPDIRINLLDWRFGLFTEEINKRDFCIGFALPGIQFRINIYPNIV